MDTQQSKITVVTPEMAQWWLNTSPGNRSINAKWVDSLAHMMTSGQWEITNQGIGFDQDGRLRDGHHRLLACVKAGVPFSTWVIRGMGERAFENIDTGVKRTLSFRCGMSRTITDIAYHACAYAGNREQVSPSEVRQMLDGGLYELADRLLSSCTYKRKYFGSGTFKLAACIVMHQLGPDNQYPLIAYRNLSSDNIEPMQPAQRAIYMQVIRGQLNSSDRDDTLARGMFVLHPDNAKVNRIAITAAAKERFIATARKTLRAIAGI